MTYRALVITHFYTRTLVEDKPVAGNTGAITQTVMEFDTLEEYTAFNVGVVEFNLIQSALIQNKSPTHSGIKVIPAFEV